MTFTVRSLNAGGVQTLTDEHGHAYQSAVRKRPLAEPQYLSARGFDGDASFEDCHHTPNMDVHVFSLDRYPHFEALAQRALPVPAFGENLSVSGGLETHVCIGDRYTNGDAIVEVSQPTERCGTPGRSLGIPMLRTWIEACLYTGYYLRVIQPGFVAPGDEFTLLDRPLPEWSVDRVNRALFRDYADRELYETVLSLPFLGSDWKERAVVLRARRLTASARASGAAAEAAAE